MPGSFAEVRTEISPTVRVDHHGGDGARRQQEAFFSWSVNSPGMKIDSMRPRWRPSSVDAMRPSSSTTRSGVHVPGTSVSRSEPLRPSHRSAASVARAVVLDRDCDAGRLHVDVLRQTVDAVLGREQRDVRRRRLERLYRVARHGGGEVAHRPARRASSPCSMTSQSFGHAVVADVDQDHLLGAGRRCAAQCTAAPTAGPARAPPRQGGTASTGARVLRPPSEREHLRTVPCPAGSVATTNVLGRLRKPPRPPRMGGDCADPHSKVLAEITLPAEAGGFSSRGGTGCRSGRQATAAR